MTGLTPPVEIEILAFGEEAAATIAALHCASFPADTGERWRAEDIATVLRLPGAFGLVARREDGVVGHALARIVGEDCELLALGSLPETRREGVARSLLARLMTLCASRGVRSLFLEVREDNDAARRLYRQAGFRAVGLRRAYYRAPDGTLRNAVTMKCDISQDGGHENTDM